MMLVSLTKTSIEALQHVPVTDELMTESEVAQTPVLHTTVSTVCEIHSMGKTITSNASMPCSSKFHAIIHGRYLC